MNSIFQLNKLVAVVFIIAFTHLVSCDADDDDKGLDHSPKNIKITGANVINDTLELKDDSGRSAKTFRVHPRNRIMWLIKTNDVTNIDTIYKKPGSDDVFKAPPERDGQSRNWKGIIRSGTKGKIEEYSIGWIDTSGKKHTYDPKIQVY